MKPLDMTMDYSTAQRRPKRTAQRSMNAMMENAMEDLSPHETACLVISVRLMAVKVSCVIENIVLVLYLVMASPESRTETIT